MKEQLKNAIREFRSGNLSGAALEDMEELLLCELRQNEDPDIQKEVIGALAVSATPLAVPTLLAIVKNTNVEIAEASRFAVNDIRERARKRRSMLPDEYFTTKHWRPIWKGSKNALLSYASAIVHIVDKSGDVTAKIDEVGDILIEEMGIDVSPCNNFMEYRICASDWDFKKDYGIVLDRIEQERALEMAEELGIDESLNTFIIDHLMDLRYDYLLTRLRLKGDHNYHRFVLKIAECLNGKA